MSDYLSIAEFYDELNRDVDYSALADLCEAVFRRAGLAPEIVLDAGCGTGKLVEELASRGYDMIGVDGSADMLSIAQNRLSGNEKVLLLQQDFLSLELYNPADACLCMYDCVNSLSSTGELAVFFSRVCRSLRGGGVFLFDVNSEYKFRNVFADNIYCFDESDVFMVWQNDYDENRRSCDFILTYFVRSGKEYRRIDETITEHVFSAAEIQDALAAAGFTDIEVFGGPDFAAPAPDAERLYFTAKRGDNGQLR